MLPTTLSSVNATFRGKDRIVAFAVWGAVISGMAAVGPLLGGWLTTYFTWPWIFIVNIPIGIAVIIGALFAVRETRAKITEPGLDVDGLLLSAIGFGGVIFALIEGQSLGWWKPIAPFSVFGIEWPRTRRCRWSRSSARSACSASCCSWCGSGTGPAAATAPRSST